MNKTTIGLIAVLALAIPVAVCAQQTKNVSVTTGGIAPAVQQDGVTSLTLSVTETMPVKQDLVVASVRYEAKGNDAQSVQSQINDAVKKGLDAIKGDPEVKISTEAYQVYNNQSQTQETVNGKTTTKTVDEWRGSQMVTLQSSNIEKMKTLTGQLQGMGFAVNNFSYTLSPQKGEEVRNTLMKGAVDKIKAQAQQASTLLGKKGYDIKEVNVDGGNMNPIPMFKGARMEMAMSADASMPAPNAEAGEQDVSMTLNARVELK